VECEEDRVKTAPPGKHRDYSVATTTLANMPAQAYSPPSSPEKDFFAFGEDYVKSPEHIPATIESIDFDRLLDTPLLLHQDLAVGCGGMLWPAGIRMAKYLLKMKREEMRNAESMCV